MQKKDTFVILNKNNFTQEILAHNGYFVDQIPPCFSTNSLANAFNGKDFCKKLFSTFNIKKVKTYPIEISIYKAGLLRRVLSFPNILAYLKLLSILQSNFDEYKDLISSKNSESPANILTTLDYPSNFRQSMMNRNIKFSGNKYKLTIDITNCYSSIYSHSISWALLGKETAKAMAMDYNLQNGTYDKANQIDRANTRLKLSETNGLITGPFSSRIISEIILGAIDKILADKGYEFSRYVDDYNFYFTSKYDCEKAIGDIATILSEYNFKINESKIKIEEYPFDVLEDYAAIFNQPLNSKFPAYNTLQTAALLDSNGKKGTYKYAFKLLRNNKSLQTCGYYETKCLFYELISIIINRPPMARFAVEMISTLQVEFSADEMIDKLNDLLEKELSSHHDQEVLWLLYIILRYSSKITPSNICTILSKSNDFAIMMVLDLLNNHRDQIANYDIIAKEVDETIKEHLILLEKELSSENLFSKRWFLVYEINYNNLTPYELFKSLTLNDATYKQLKDSYVDFYISVFKKQ